MLLHAHLVQAGSFAKGPHAGNVIEVKSGTPCRIFNCRFNGKSLVQIVWSLVTKGPTSPVLRKATGTFVVAVLLIDTAAWPWLQLVPVVLHLNCVRNEILLYSLHSYCSGHEGHLFVPTAAWVPGFHIGLLR